MTKPVLSAVAAACALLTLSAFAQPAAAPVDPNSFLNQFSITGPHHTRRPDIILFVNGLPLVLTQVCQL